MQKKKSGCFGNLVLLGMIIGMILVIIYFSPQTPRVLNHNQTPSSQNLIDQIKQFIQSMNGTSTTSKQRSTVKLSSFSTDDLSLYGSPTLNPTQIDKILTEHNSPAAGIGQVIYNLGVQYGVDPAFALAFFQHESTWGNAGMARETHSPGNIRCYDGAACDQGYAAYGSWAAGFQAWYSLIVGPVYKGSGLTTVAQIIPKYAPPSDNNDDAAYIASVLASVQQFRNEVQA